MTTKTPDVSPIRASHDVLAWCEEVGISRPTFYTIYKDPKRAPKTVTIGRRRLVIESPREYLDRMAALAQKAQLDKALQRVAA